MVKKLEGLRYKVTLESGDAPITIIVFALKKILISIVTFVHLLIKTTEL